MQYPPVRMPCPPAGLRRSRVSALVGLLVVVAALLAGGRPAAADTRTVPCDSFADATSLPDGSGRATCWSVSVPLARGGDGSLGTVELAVEEARKGRPRGGTAILALTGGPGQSGLPFAASFADELERVKLPIIVMDQRGTGISRVVDCRSTETEIQVLSRTAACAASLGAAAAWFRTADTVEDIEAVRQALGYSKLILFGVSYGTYVAERYAAAHPDRVAKLVLDSPLPATGAPPFTTTTFAAFRRILAGLCASQRCATGRDVVGATARLLDAIRAKGRVAVPIVDSGGAHKRISITTSEIQNLIYDGDFDTRYRSWFPSAVAMALRGDWSLMARLVQLDRDPSQADPLVDFSSGLFIATVCTDEAPPWPATATDLGTRLAAEDAALAAQPPGSFMPFAWQDLGSTSALPDACAAWPADARPTEAPVTALPQVPTLVLVGRSDSRTPIENLPAIRSLLPRATVVQLPNQGHSVDSTANCTGPRVQAWLLHVRPRCKANPRVVPLPLLPRSVSAFGGAGARAVAQVTYAFLHTYVVAYDDASASAYGSLYGGTAANVDLTVGRHGFTYSASALHLRAYSAIPGVTVSGADRYRLVGADENGFLAQTASPYVVHLPGGRKARMVVSLTPKGALAVHGTYRGATVDVTIKDLAFDPWSGVASSGRQAPGRRIELHRKP